MGNENVKYERREYVPPEGFVVPEGFKVRAIDDRPVTYEYMVARAKEMMEEVRICTELGEPNTYAEMMAAQARLEAANIPQEQINMLAQNNMIAQTLRQLDREAV